MCFVKERSVYQYRNRKYGFKIMDININPNNKQIIFSSSFKSLVKPFNIKLGDWATAKYYCDPTIGLFNIRGFNLFIHKIDALRVLKWLHKFNSKYSSYQYKNAVVVKTRMKNITRAGISNTCPLTTEKKIISLECEKIKPVKIISP